MGCITSGIDNSEAFMLSRKIDEKLKLEGIDFRRQVKLLLLGTGESGKSTILKQLKVIHEKGFTDKEKEDYKYIIWGNITHSLRLLLESCLKHTALSKELHEKAQGVLGLIEEDSGNLKLPGKLSESIVNLWSHTEFKELCKNKDVCQVWTGDGVSYFLDNIERVISPSYVPSSYEIMLARSKTTGIVERSFIYKDLKFRIFDVGGQRSERRKWIHCFEDVTCLLFCVACSEYDETLIEDVSVNRLRESLQLFESICNNRYFLNTSIILFLNKMDLFKEKLRIIPFRDYFPEYTGDEKNWEEAASFIEEKFKKLYKGGEEIYAKRTCATDTDNMRFMFDAVTDIIIANHFSSCYL